MALNLQLLQRQSIIILSEKSSVDKFQTKGLIILVVVILGAEVFVTIARGVLLEEAGKVFQVFLLVSFEVAAYNDNCLLYTSPSPRDLSTSRMPSSA